MSDLVRRYDLTVNILKAQITPRKEGYLTLEISGGEDNCLKGIAYLREQDVTVTAEEDAHIVVIEMPLDEQSAQGNH